MEKQKNKQNGITLIALVVTIIVLIILAGVSINMLVGDNGIITQAQKAAEDTKLAQEKEMISLAMLERKMGNTDIEIGTPLYSKTIANGTKWHILTDKNTGTIYGDGYQYVPKGTKIQNYGETTKDWLINLETSEIVSIHEGDYIETYYGMNLAVTDGLLLNVDPVNMQDENSWGEGVTLYGVTPGDGYGYNGDAIVLDGVDDYIEIYADTPIEEGFTFEFYGRAENNIYMLSKTVLGDEENYGHRFRINWGGNWFRASFSGENSQSDWMTGGNAPHWIEKWFDFNFNVEGGNYFTLTANLQNNTISLYLNGEFLDSTVCDHDWIVSGDLTNSAVPFTIGLTVAGTEYNPGYTAMELYTCRLYNKVLTDKEIKENYETTVAYRQK